MTVPDWRVGGTRGPGVTPGPPIATPRSYPVIQPLAWLVTMPFATYMMVSPSAMPVCAPPPIDPALMMVQLFVPPPGPYRAMLFDGVMVPVTVTGFCALLVSVMPSAYLPEMTVIGALVNAAIARSDR